jgi:hypothetical protein
LAKDEQRGPGDLDDESSAADEPTAVWDIDALRKAGLTDVLDAQDSASLGPATPAVGMERPSIIIEEQPAAPRAQKPPTRPPRRPTGMSWPLLGAIAGGLSALAYVLIRLLR